MKKVIVLLSLCIFLSEMYSQNTMKGKTQINAGLGFSNYGIPIYVGLDYGIHPDISIGAQGAFRSYDNSGFKASIIELSGNVNYHFNSILKIKDNHWDVYAGLSVGYWIWNWDTNFPGSNASGAGLYGQLGGRYFFNPKWAVNLEFGGGTMSGGKLGITHRF